MNSASPMLWIASYPGPVAATARDEFSIEPRVALISYSNFGSAHGEEAERTRKAVLLCQELAPDLKVDGEMHADVAVDSEVLAERYPFNRLGRAANVLVFPSLEAGNVA